MAKRKKRTISRSPRRKRMSGGKLGAKMAKRRRRKKKIGL